MDTKEEKRVGYIYKAFHKDTPETFYIGSTEGKLIKRLQAHKGSAKHKKNEKTKWFEHLREKNFTDFRIVQLERVEFTHKQELLVREDAAIRALNPPLNTISPIRTEYYKKIYWQQYHKKHKAAHLDHYREVGKLYREKCKQKFHCTCCNVSPISKAHYIMHLNTRKHKKRMEPYRIDNLMHLENIFD